MGFGIQNATNVTFDNITSLTNFSGDPMQFVIKANAQIYDGWFYFVMLCIIWFIMYRVIQDKTDQPLNNIMYTGIVVSIISFFFRAISMTQNGVVIGLLNDFQMWIFPLITASVAAIVYFIKE